MQSASDQWHRVERSGRKFLRWFRLPGNAKTDEVKARVENGVLMIACPRLSIDWGDAFKKPLLTSLGVEIALGDIPAWWERKLKCTKSEDCCKYEGMQERGDMGVDYPMDAQDGGEWNSCYSKKPNRPLRGK
ncbi:unnamed protein product [Fraxinus pennsylvanica]|uniref:SHSP domain-containing protein n=1 Tax=Fraxinus pennsylvanica TaxID=56036 RepID=A0AAD1Z952_9LAMI|nr:unnamed protein product [Fraxinus pennsylvanica]